MIASEVDYRVSVKRPSRDTGVEAECFLCGRISDRVVFRECGFEARQCHCGVLYTSPLPPAGAVDSTVDLHSAAYYKYPADLRVAFLEKHRPEGRLLEVGCGDGYFLQAAKARGYDVAGIEAHPGRAQGTRERLGVQVEAAYIENTCLPAKSFDVVYHCDMLSHFPDPKLALSRMVSLMRPDGIFYFEVGLVADLRPWWYRFMGSIRMPEHRWFYTLPALNRLCDECGLRIVHVKRFGLAPGFFLSQFGRMTGLGGAATAPVDRASSVPRRVEGPLRQKARIMLRYGLGSLVAGIGPETAFVLARHR